MLKKTNNCPTKKKLQFSAIILLICFSNVCNGQRQSIDLSGTWQFALDSLNQGVKGNWFSKDLPDKITLPGSTDQGGYGISHIPGTPFYNGEQETWRLVRKHRYIGPAWYQKTITIPPSWKEKHISLFLERCMWQTKLWVNGKYIGEEHSLNSPHEYDLSRFLKPGKNSISLRIDNSPYVHLGSWSHGYSPGMQTIWNGAIGKIQLLSKTPVHMQDVQVYPSLKNQEIKIAMQVVQDNPRSLNGVLTYIIRNRKQKIIQQKKEKVFIDQGLTKVQSFIKLDKSVKAWNEFHPELYTLEVQSDFGKQKDQAVVRFGLRELEAKDGKILINSNTVFMRGEHDGGSFPLTGYPSMEKRDWLHIFEIGKKYGLNHWRFHSWCPPKAAFDAADEIGIYLQPELTLFSQDWENTLVGTDAGRDDFLFSELAKLLKTYGNHPSFVLMAMGNELRGKHKVLEDWVTWAKDHDSRHLYASSANLEAMGIYEKLPPDDFQVAHAGKVDGHRIERRMYPYFNKEKPNTDSDYSRSLDAPFNQWPIISHEVGQWTVFPDFSEIPDYKGVLSPRNLEVFKSRLRQKGMLDQARDFLMASGKLSAILYKEEMEKLLRTPGMAGFQLLDLRDYQAQGSALVGILNAFWKSKGFITADEFRESCNALTLLLKMPKRSWSNQESFSAQLVLPNYGPSDIKELKINWEVTDAGKKLFSGEKTSLGISQGKVHPFGEISFSLKNIKKATKLIISLRAPDIHIKNDYAIWVYPTVLSEGHFQEIIIAKEASPELLKKIKEGAKVLLIPESGYDVEKTQFTTPFWSTILFNYQVKTMGILCQPSHPVFKDFPTDFHSDWQWWSLTHNGKAARLNNTPADYRPLIQFIDHPVRNDKLGALMETRIGKGKLMVCTFDILNASPGQDVARQLKYSILNYMNSGLFNPEEVEGLQDIFFKSIGTKEITYNKITSNNEHAEYPAFFAFDGDQKTYWQSSKVNSSSIIFEIELEKPRYLTGSSFIIKDSGYIPDNFKIYISDKKDDPGKPIIIGNLRKKNTFEALSWDNGFTIQKGKKGKFIKIEFEQEIANEELMRINELQWTFGD